jgi:hypothetical protein
MFAVRRLARAFLLALLLPALLAPRGWAWQVCFCLTASDAASDMGAANGCCTAFEPAPSALDSSMSCCEPTSDGTSETGCGDCGDCRSFDAGNRALQPSQGVPELPTALPIEHLVALESPMALPAYGRTLASRGLAPPGAPPRSLPLRI